MEENKINSQPQNDNQEIINNLVKQGKYDEVMKLLNAKEQKEEDEMYIKEEELQNLELDISSLKEKDNQSKNESESSILFIPHENGYEGLLDDNELKSDNQQNILLLDNKIEENDNAKNLEILTKELQDLENVEEENKNNIEQLDEMYKMIQEDKLSKGLQIETRNKLFPYYSQTIFNVNGELKSDLFMNLSMVRQCYISSLFINPKKTEGDIHNIESKYKPKKSKSVFEDIEILSKYKKGKVDYDELMLSFEKENENFESLITESYKDFIKRKDNIQEKKEVILINIESTNTANNINNNNRKLILNIVKSWIKNSNLNDNNKDEKMKYNIKDFNTLFLNSFITKKIDNSELSKNSLLELTLTNQNFKEIPSNIIKPCKNLKSLNLEENQIDKISHLENCPNLYSLNLNKNRITKIENISHLTLLEKLSLNSNFIEHIENCQHNQRLKFLSIWKNKINSIESIESQLLYIEELTLSENNIKFIPEKLSMPYLKYLDLNANKIKNLNDFFYCPSLEKLLLQDNKIVGDTIDSIFHFCEKLKEIDLSFNKIEYASFVFGILQSNQNIESIDVRSNPFFMITGKLCVKMFKKLFPKLKTINNDNIPKEKMKLKIQREYKYKSISPNYFDIFQLKKAFFMKYFSSIIFTNKVLNTFNLNISSELCIEKVPIAEIINYYYFNFKQNHLSSLGNLFDKKFVNLSECSKLQNELLIYLYDFKHKMIYLKSSMGIFSKNLTLRLLKIQRIQQTWKIFYLRKQLNSIKFIDEDKGNYDELLDFFGNNNEHNDNSEPKFDWEDEKIKEIEQNLKNIGNSIKKEKDIRANEEKKKEEEEKRKNEEQKEKNEQESKEKENLKEENELISSFISNNNNNNNINLLLPKKHIILESIKENDNENDDQAYLKKSINSLTKSKQLTPLKPPTGQGKLNILQSIPEQPIQNANNNLYYNQMKKNDKENEMGSNPSTPNTINHQDEFNISKTRYYPQISNKFRQGDNIHLRVVNMNNQMRIPIKKSSKIFGQRPESNLKLPTIKSNINIDTSSVNNDDTRSIRSGLSAVSNKFSTYKGKPLPAKAIEQIRKIEEQCKIAIKNAKEEWNGLDHQTMVLISKKISKKYKKQINRIIENL